MRAFGEAEAHHSSACCEEQPECVADRALDPEVQQDAADRLVGGAVVGAEPRWILQRATPESERRLRQKQQTAERDARSSPGGDSRCPPLPAHDQVDDEHARRQLDRGRQPDQDSLREAVEPAQSRPHQIQQAAEHQERIDLPESEAVRNRQQVEHSHREKPENPARAMAGAGEKAATGVPHDQQVGRQLQREPDPPDDLERQQCQRDCQDGRERRVGKG
ncbi:hypothetical protein VV02_25765 [Luteipulveratus mongoliensis]|uniref:Uncharacterized protein n=1 Tax=Luteipulveratus mongoliensis TaxID=571913 RepID=A0A0K1JP23_9MICO|nr:hypothetical protein VV02_25765 [Luteipulveratus mongoliensis]